MDTNEKYKDALKFMESQYDYFKNVTAEEQAGVISNFKQEMYDLAVRLADENERRLVFGIEANKVIKQDKSYGIPEGMKIDIGDGLRYCYDLKHKELVLYGSDTRNIKVLFSLADRIAVHAITHCYYISEVYLPCCKQIAYYGLSSNIALESIYAPELKILKSSALAYNTNLVDIIVPKLRTIDKYALCECKKLSEFTGNNVKRVGKNAFENCINLTKLELLNAEVVEADAFSGCSNLIEINIPKLGIVRP